MVNVVHSHTVIMSSMKSKGQTANLGSVVVLSNSVKGQISRRSHNKVRQVEREREAELSGPLSRTSV